MHSDAGWIRFGRRGARLLAALLVVAAPLTVVGVAPASAVTVKPLWSVATGPIGESSPLVVNLDGTNDVVVGSTDHRLYALRGGDGAAVGGWPVTTTSPIGSSPSAADTDADGKPEVFVGAGTDFGQNGGFYSFAAGGAQRFRFQPTDKDRGNLSVVTAPGIGDVNGDGVPDVTVFALGLQSWSLNQTGAVNRGWPFYTDDTVFSSPALVDVNGDGRTDIVDGGDVSPGGPVDGRGGILRALSGDGKVLWSHQFDEIVRSSPSIGDVTGDGRPDIVVGSGNYWVNHCQDPLPADCRGQVGAADATKIFVFDLAGNLEWSKDLGAQTLASPALADVNGDGRLDVVEGTWQGAQPGQVWALDGAKGDTLPGYPRASGGGVVIGGITTADFNDDGAQDLLVPTGGGMYAYDGRNGSKLFSIEEGQVSFQNSAVITDLDGGGRLDIVVAGVKPSTGQGVVERFELSAGAKIGTKAWTMFRGDARRTGNVTPPPLRQSGVTPPTTARPASTPKTTAAHPATTAPRPVATTSTTAPATTTTTVAAEVPPSTTSTVAPSTSTTADPPGAVAAPAVEPASSHTSSPAVAVLALVAVIAAGAAAVVWRQKVRRRKVS